MKPVELYKAFKRGLGTSLTAAGFKPTKGGVALWVKPHEAGWLFVSCMGNKWGWSEPFGSDFCLTVLWGDSERYSANFGQEHTDNPGHTHILEFFDVAAIRRFCEHRNAVIDKGLQRAARVDDLVGRIDGCVQSAGKVLEKDDPPLPLASVVFPWVDVEDIELWSEFLRPIIHSCDHRMSQLMKMGRVSRQSYLRDCWKQADLRSETEKAEHRAAKKVAREASWQAISAIGRELEKKT